MSEKNIKDTITRMDGLVDKYWDRHASLMVTWRGNSPKTCLLGLAGLALYGEEWRPDYRPFGGYRPFEGAYNADPAAVELVKYIAAQVPGRSSTSPIDSVTRYNDHDLHTKEQVHEFLKGLS